MVGLESCFKLGVLKLIDDNVGEEEAIEINTKVVNNSNKEDESMEVDEVINIKESKNHPLEQVIEVYVAQPSGFIDFEQHNFVYKLKKALYGLNQALKACQSKYIKEMLKKFGLEDSKPTKMPMSTEINLTKDDEADSVDSTKYRYYV
nr:hypothetical protein [Tanacetum cinerariifolium]